MGTQHSLLSGQQQYGKPQTDRGKTQSPYSSKRGILTSKSPIGREDRFSDMANSPSAQRHTEQKASAAIKTKLKNQILSSQISPSKVNQLKQVIYIEQRTPTKGQLLNQLSLSNNDISGLNAKKLYQNENQEIQKLHYQQVSNSTKAGAKRFTFEQVDERLQRLYQKSQDKVEEFGAGSPIDEETDIRIKVYYNSTKYVNIGWSSKNSSLTCGWLISEVMRKLRFEEEFNRKLLITGMKNISNKGSECYDYLLTQLETQSEKHLIASITSVTSNFSPINSDNIQPAQLTLDDFELIKVIGKGGFSKVFQVRKKDTGKIYAMKTLSKSKIKRDNKVENILNERAILERVAHPFIVQMKYAFQNEDYLFLILEFCAGGELFYRLNNIPQGRMTEKQAKFYFAEILEAIQYLHDTDILYRDLKPENIVIDENGHARLTDFGLSKVGFKQLDRAYSFCGSPEYMAPEMLETERHRLMGEAPMYHNRSLDFYHLGALLYEMLIGLPPFFSEDRQKMYKDIMFTHMHIPSFLSPECRNLLKGLLQKNPEKRIGNSRGVIEIKEHPWCADIQWDKVAKKEIEPPFKPFLNKSNFDPEYTSMDPILQDDDPLLSLEEIEKAKSGEFMEEYENRIAKQKSKQSNHQHMENEQLNRLSRQHSIELYARENNTFRGYSFLNDNGQQPTQYGFDQEMFGFCLNESKDQSFVGIGSPLEDLEYLMSEPQALNNQIRLDTTNNLKSPNDQELIMMLSAESKNQQSQQSILSEGIESMKVNINHVVGGNKKQYGQQSNVVKVMLNQNYLQKDQHKMQQQQSKESLYNELISTFDYSVSKKEKNEVTLGTQNKKNTNNLTNSTMSLFSLNQLQQEQKQVHRAHYGHNKDKSKDERGGYSKEKLEYQKINRKYSPEIDIERALIQVKQKKQFLEQAISNQGVNSHKSTSIVQKSVQLENLSSLRGSSQATKVVKQKTQYSEYNAVGSGYKPNKIGGKKRDSELTAGGNNHNTNSSHGMANGVMSGIHGNQSPHNKSMLKLGSGVKKINQGKSHFNSVLKPSYPNDQFNRTSKQSVNASQSNFNQTLKTQQLYSQIHTKVSNKKTRNFSNQNNVEQKDSIKGGKKMNEECKIESNYQTLQQLKTDNSGDGDKFIVEQITANEFLGSFLSSGSKTKKKMLTGKNGELNNMMIEGNDTIRDDQSFDDASKEAIAALILNQSHESCCCSDDEFNTKMKKLEGTSPNKQSQKNIKRLQYNALQESIKTNQDKHRINNEKPTRHTMMTGKLCITDKDSNSFFNNNDYLSQNNYDDMDNIHNTSNHGLSIHLEESKHFPEDERVQSFKSYNTSVIDRGVHPKLDQLKTPNSLQKKQSSQMHHNQMPKLSTGHKITSPSNLSLMNKTTPISPLRDRSGVGGSKLKERPGEKMHFNIGLNVVGSQTSILTTPKGSQIGQNLLSTKGESRQSVQSNKLANTIGGGRQQNQHRIAGKHLDFVTHNHK